MNWGWRNGVALPTLRNAFFPITGSSPTKAHYSIKLLYLVMSSFAQPIDLLLFYSHTPFPFPPVIQLSQIVRLSTH